MDKRTKIRRTAKAGKIVSTVAFYFSIAISVIMLVLAILFEVNTSFRSVLQKIMAENLFLEAFIEQIFLLVVIFCLMKLFKTIEEERTPFSHKANKWLKVLSIVILVSSAFENALYKTILNMFEGKLTFSTNISFDTTSLVIGLAILLLSFIFEYGSDLQKQDDETL